MKLSGTVLQWDCFGDGDEWNGVVCVVVYWCTHRSLHVPGGPDGMQGQTPFKSWQETGDVEEMLTEQPDVSCLATRPPAFSAGTFTWGLCGRRTASYCRRVHCLGNALRLAATTLRSG